ncbi:MAG TPA: hypothetical protein VF538_10840 [Pyrinomonadaceae bacterium]|jgi:hypothetical protein
MTPTEPAASTAWEEKSKPGEQELFDDFAREIAEQQQEAAREAAERQRKGELSPQSEALFRGFHAKTHAGVMAEFEVLDGLPECARFGVFGTPRVFPALVRFSNGDFHLNPDKHHEPRGIAIKLIGVGGRKLLPGREDAVTQDFLATSHSVTSTVRDIRQFVAFIRAARNPVTLPVTLAREVGVFESARILADVAGTVALSKVRSMATEHYAGTAPIKLGPYAVKFTVRPAEGTPEPQSRPLTDDFLREELADRLRAGDLMFDFLLQFYVDDEHTPIEDTSVEWEPEHAPFVRVARLRIPRCDLDDPATHALSEEVKKLSFTPWHATEDHRPLGNVMRARRVAYEASAALRGHRPEPTGLPL